ncbi:glucosamine 6-phosphate acetyltransferase [Thecamonas trahens ATCC 50062]|uniref:Glucosamine 6-phosphate N-acetyltransferase n=1 Tax=Thecamonas trahens ATCC 50062 TaxID=461836 RepID=A0A0L0DBE6_THETB|nr:glucosamine 6-phosphate acetyltransferase [Thecamonas trahens ATCC 50062]KNC49436.1 glucosamine 6-phosphate acetyltransferase [Thecamonas trahens ATCC 50062]|eukprot:XP_013757858.1 glucosamine 6-phosphate acetyltransferase [Thecamonas trahens ATCC 50062]
MNGYGYGHGGSAVPQPATSATAAASAAASHLFDPSLLSEAADAQPGDGYTVRPLARSDYAAGHCGVLADLTDVGDMDAATWAEVFDEMAADGKYYVVVVEEDATGMVVASGTLVVERKFIHGGARAGHIEDIVVVEAARGLSLGRVIIEQLKALSVVVGCYKTILDCADKVVGFYGKLGFEVKGNFMAAYHDH